MEKHTRKIRGNGQGCAYKSPNGKSWTAQAVVGYRAPKQEGGQPIPIKRKKSGFAKKSDALAYVPILLAGGVEKSKVAPRLSDYWKIYSENAMLKIGRSKQDAYKAAWSDYADKIVASADLTEETCYPVISGGKNKVHVIIRFFPFLT